MRNFNKINKNLITENLAAFIPSRSKFYHYAQILFFPSHFYSWCWNLNFNEIQHWSQFSKYFNFGLTWDSKSIPTFGSQTFRFSRLVLAHSASRLSIIPPQNPHALPMDPTYPSRLIRNAACAFIAPPSKRVSGTYKVYWERWDEGI